MMMMMRIIVKKDNDMDAEHKEDPSSDIGSSYELIGDHFSIHEMKEKVDEFDTKNECVNAKVGPLDTKMDLVLKSISKIKFATPSIQDREK